MNKLSGIAKRVRTLVTRHSPEILTGVGIAGMVSTVIMSVRETPKALMLIEEEKRHQNQKLLEEAKQNDDELCERIDKLRPKEVIIATWRCYIPAVITGGISIACLIGANSVNAKRNTALATAYSLSESAFRDYQSKVVETIGEKKEQEVIDAIAKDKIEANPIDQQSVMIVEGNGSTLCYDSMFGGYFRSDMDSIKKAENQLNKQMRDELYISLNDLYYEIGRKAIGIGNEFGWNMNDGYIDLQFSSLLTEHGTPCLVMSYRTAPRCNYQSSY